MAKREGNVWLGLWAWFGREMMKWFDLLTVAFECCYAAVCWLKRGVKFSG